MSGQIEFKTGDVEIAARYVAELTRQCIEFVLETDGIGIVITITGF